MMNRKLLIVDRPERPLGHYTPFLEAHGLDCTVAETDDDVLALVETDAFSLLLLNMDSLPWNGLALCRRLRGTSHMPLLMLHPHPSIADVVQGLEAGADDYLTGAFEASEVLARIRALLRRHQEYSAPQPIIRRQLQAGSLRIDLRARQAFLEDRRIVLTEVEFRLLKTLMQSGGNSVPRERLVETAWGGDAPPRGNSLSVLIYRLRSKIERDPNQPERLLTVRGYGYRLCPCDED